MKTRIINKEGLIWDFETIKKAKRHIKKEKHNDYEIEENHDGKKIRIYREQAD